MAYKYDKRHGWEPRKESKGCARWQWVLLIIGIITMIISPPVGGIILGLAILAIIFFN